MLGIKSFCLMRNEETKEHLIIPRSIIYELNEKRQAIRIDKELIKKEINGRLLYKTNNNKFIRHMSILDTDDNRDTLRSRWQETEKRVRTTNHPYTPSASNVPDSKEYKKKDTKKHSADMQKYSSAAHLRDLLSTPAKLSQPKEVEEKKTKSSIKNDERRPLRDIGNKMKDDDDDETPRRKSSSVSDKSTSSKVEEEPVIKRKKIQEVKGIGWKRRIEQNVTNLQEALSDLRKHSSYDEMVEKTAKLKESTVIDKGEQLTTIDDVLFTSTQLTNVLRQKSMKKRLSVLVPIVWSKETIKKKYIDRPTDTDDYLLISDADKFKFDQICLHLQHRRKIVFKRGGDDDLELNSKSWLSRRCIELRSIWKKKSAN